MSVKIAIEFKMDVIFAPNLNLSLFPHYWWEFDKQENKNKLVELKALIDTMGIKSASLKDKFLF